MANSSRREASWTKRMQKATRAVVVSGTGGGARERARRVRQMLRGQLKAANGVVMQFADAETFAAQYEGLSVVDGHVVIADPRKEQS